MDTVLPADTLEFCPHPDAQHIFVCGTYRLDDEKSDSTHQPQHRRGQCLVLEAVRGAPVLLQSIDLPAVLDMKWCHRSQSENATLAVADSEGNISLHEWEAKERMLKQRSLISCASTETLCLSLDWSNRRAGGSDLGSLVVSLSNGSLCLLRPVDGSDLVITDRWHAHDYEPWIAAWNYWDPAVIYSGGDDLKLKAWDTRQGFSQPAFVHKHFDAGITSIQSHPHVEHLIAVGSYNNKVQLFDTRKLSIPTSQVDVGGGAWRVKWHPSSTRKHDLLVACMHDGFKVVRFNLEGKNEVGKIQDGEIINHFEAHTSLAYGADWSFSSSNEHSNTLIGSCSFYDHRLHLWEG